MMQAHPKNERAARVMQTRRRDIFSEVDMRKESDIDGSTQSKC